MPDRSGPGRCRRRLRGDRGTVTILIIGFAVVLLLLITVVVNVSKAFLVQRSLSAAADGAALAAANAIDETAVYAGKTGDSVPLDPQAVQQAVARYAADAGLDTQFVGFQVVQASTDGTTATVTLAAVVRMPFINHVSQQYAGGYPLHVTARARSPLDN